MAEKELTILKPSRYMQGKNTLIRRLMRGQFRFIKPRPMYLQTQPKPPEDLDLRNPEISIPAL